jgi:hypothetical protein
MAELTPRIARANCSRRIAKIDASLVAMAGHWGDLDQTVVDVIEDIRTALYDLRADMDAGVEYAEQCVAERS